MGNRQPEKVSTLDILPHKLLDIYNVGKKGVTNGNLFHMPYKEFSSLGVTYLYIPLYLSLNKRGKGSQYESSSTSLPIITMVRGKNGCLLYALVFFF
jgi:hypothetical protein